MKRQFCGRGGAEVYQEVEHRRSLICWRDRNTSVAAASWVRDRMKEEVTSYVGP